MCCWFALLLHNCCCVCERVSRVVELPLPSSRHSLLPMCVVSMQDEALIQAILQSDASQENVDSQLGSSMVTDYVDGQFSTADTLSSPLSSRHDREGEEGEPEQHGRDEQEQQPPLLSPRRQPVKGCSLDADDSVRSGTSAGSTPARRVSTALPSVAGPAVGSQFVGRGLGLRKQSLAVPAPQTTRQVSAPASRCDT